MGSKRRDRVLSRLFELRSVIAMLFTIYGVVCLVCGLAFTSQAQLDKAAGVNVNLWTGIAMLLFGGAFGGWALLGARPEEAAAAADRQREQQSGEGR